LAPEGVVAGATVEDVVAVAAVELVGAALAVHVVTVAAPVDLVGAATAVDDVVAVTREDAAVAPPGEDRVTADRPPDHASVTAAPPRAGLLDGDLAERKLPVEGLLVVREVSVRRLSASLDRALDRKRPRNEHVEPEHDVGGAARREGRQRAGGLRPDRAAAARGGRRGGRGRAGFRLLDE